MKWSESTARFSAGIPEQREMYEEGPSLRVREQPVPLSITAGDEAAQTASYEELHPSHMPTPSIEKKPGEIPLFRNVRRSARRQHPSLYQYPYDTRLCCIVKRICQVGAEPTPSARLFYLFAFTPTC